MCDLAVHGQFGRCLRSVCFSVIYAIYARVFQLEALQYFCVAYRPILFLSFSVHDIVRMYINNI